MKETWASGSVELLHHAQNHFEFESAADRRIAFISIDNATELMLSTYVTMPSRNFGERTPSRGEIERADGNFPRLLDLTYKLNPKAFDDISLNDIEYYHRLRNMLYHEGTGISVDATQLKTYFDLATILLLRLYNVKLAETDLPASLRETKITLLREARAELDKEFNSRQSVIVKAANERIRSAGGKIGRDLKPLSRSQEKKLEELWAKNLSVPKISEALNKLGARFDPPRTVSESSVKRRIQVWIESGRLEPRTKPRTVRPTATPPLE